MIKLKRGVFTSPIAIKLVIVLVACSSFITLVATTTQLYRDYRHDVDTITDHFTYIEKSLLKGVSQSVWVLDAVQADLLLEGIIQGQMIEYAAIKVDGTTRWQKGALTAKDSMAVSFPLTQLHRGRQITIGELAISANMDQIYQQLTKRGGFILFSNVLKTLLVITVVFFSFHFLVTRHLAAISNYLQKIDLKEKLPQLVLSRPSHGRPDELDQVVLSVNKMQDNISDSFLLLELQKAELKTLSVAIEQSPAAVIITDAEGYIEYINLKVEQLTGYSKEEARGKKPSIFGSGKTPPEVYAQLWKTISAGKVWRGEFLNKAKNGSHYWESCVIAPIFSEDGTISKYVALKENITQKKQSQKEKEQLETQLRQAQKMESIGRLTGGVAHDFNNILSVINGYAEMCLMEMAEDQPFRKEIEIILQSGQRAARLTQQLLTFSRKQVIKPEVLDLAKEIDNSRKMLDSLLGEDIEIEIYHAKELWPVKADRSQLEQVVLNLAINARDAMPSGGNLTIETANIVLSESYVEKHYDITLGDYVLLAITDNGEGMDGEIKEHIFEPFYTTKDKGKGTGLGLATVYGIIKQNGGEIHVYSELGHGTTFKVYLPRADRSLEKTGDELPENDIDGVGGSETILLVEDDEGVRKLGVDVLSSLGYVMLEADNGEDALRVCSRFHGRVDLLLTDVVMPKMGGPDLALRMEELCPQIKILFMSGYTENAIVKHGVLADNVNYLQKPITPTSLSKAVRKVLG